MINQVLSYLHRHTNDYSSGQAIADRLGVTRAAVWKAVEALRAEGYEIESARAKGYKLVSVPDLLTEREVRPGLKTKTLGRKIYSLGTVDSTNTYAARLAAEGEPEGAVVVSEYQTAGRGRLGRKWVSPPGVNICMSVILRPAIPPSEAPLVTLVAACALTKAVRGLYGLDAAIKWPNDLLLSGRKAAGILTEMSAEPERVRHIILGVGVDVNMPRDAFPGEIRDISTSIMLELGGQTSRAALIRRFLEELEHYYGLLVGGGRAEVLDDWRV
ncbi:MAG TPA: biotin--[acetyl-CoA-carboxylase] ligase, partial [Nitrospirota bacterium]|nr:biotin--[acetyl-CoA-carboxylase] ligase [Nitrospirota bacterium]